MEIELKISIAKLKVMTPYVAEKIEVKIISEIKL